jgi:hypothetical protein
MRILPFSVGTSFLPSRRTYLTLINRSMVCARVAGVPSPNSLSDSSPPSSTSSAS